MARFKLEFFEDAKAEYETLDGSEKKYVMKALEKISERGDEIGDPLENKRGIILVGCRKVKLRKLGIRIVYRLNNNDRIEIIDIIAIGKRDDEEVYKNANKRIK
ncbi:type II toxin-antitoxin system RelE/ParE family toxin [Ureibacillus sp. MALMAid1270]|uniref:type II toxin-antitoxin system RelE/ParE family toxin n=1 Tax=Ureibacillus sp. MALMAid1270 TaxID=3411629 RepID=UPI003BA6EC2C